MANKKFIGLDWTLLSDGEGVIYSAGTWQSAALSTSDALAQHTANTDLHLTSDQNDALDNANSPSISNVIATMNDLSSLGSNYVVKSGDTMTGNLTAPSLTATTSIELNSYVITDILDEDNMVSDSDTALATQQSIKAYVDTTVGDYYTKTESDNRYVDITGDTMTGNLTVPSLTATTSIELNSYVISDILDEDTMSSDSDTAIATQQSIKAYVDTTVADYYTKPETDDKFVYTTGDTMTGTLILSPDSGNALETNGDVVMVGNLTVSGTTTTVNSENLNIKDNLILINSGETGAGVSLLFAGIEVDRGSLTNYVFLFDETQDNFRIGESGTPTGGTQAVATREDNPINTALAFWNDSASRFDTLSSLTFDGNNLSISGNVDGVDISTFYTDFGNHTANTDLHLTSDQNDALDGANSPSSTNVIATMNDLTSSNYWSSGSTGTNSLTTKANLSSGGDATGNYTVAIGYNTTASGYYGTYAEGWNTTASSYYGASHAEGRNTIASGDYSSHAEGYGTTASGNRGSHAEGYDTKAEGYSSHAEGYNTTASGDYSHAEGYSTTASGDYSHAEGYSTTASGKYSHASGYNTIASAKNSTASGYYTEANGMYSTTSGYKAKININSDASFNHSYTTNNSTYYLTGNYSAILGGFNNKLVAESAAILGGTGNTISHARSIILGGYDQTTTAIDTVYMLNLNIGNSTSVNAILDEDNMISDSDTALATQQSIKAYVDASVASSPSSLSGLTDTTITSPSANDFLVWNGSSWINSAYTVDLSGYYTKPETDNKFVYTTGDTMTGTLILTPDSGNALETTGNVIITGDLIVSGTTTTVNTEDLNIKDNIILLNSGETGAGVSLTYAGIQIDRGTETDAQLLWNETTDKWEIGIEGNLTNIALEGNSYTKSETDNKFVFVTGDTMTGNLTTPSLTATTSIELNSYVVTDILDEDNMVSDSDTALATQQSIKTYVDNELLNRTLTGNTDVTVTSPSYKDVLYYSAGTWVNDSIANLVDAEYVNISGDIMTGDLTLPNLTATTSIELNNSATLKAGSVTGASPVTVETIANTAGDGMVMDYVLTDGTNKRTGTLQLVWDGSTINVSESFTSDIGDTSTVNITATNSGGNIIVTATDSASGNWTVNYFRKLI